MSHPRTEHAGLFEILYRAHYQAISAYVRRRVPEADAPDVIAQVFSVAWRRFDQIPRGDESRLWLFGVARRCVADHRRSGLRRVRLFTRLVNEDGRPFSGHEGMDASHERVARALGRLREKEREVIRLIYWEGLSQDEAAQVLGCSANALGLRFRRAQARLRQSIDIRSEIDASPSAPLRALQQWETSL